MKGFSINAEGLSWIKGNPDDPDDLCLHGHATAVIGGKTLEYDDATVSATALLLLKSLTEDHIAGQEDIQMLPCCGHECYADKKLENVHIYGCPNGIDWSVRHDGDNVVLELEDGTTEVVSISEYTAEVFRFADMIEDFYKKSSPKIIMPDRKIEVSGYKAFWNEWHRRRGAQPSTRPARP